MDTEEQFYSRLYEGGRFMKVLPLDQFEREKLAAGKRYALVSEDLAARAPRGGTLVELGCGGAEALQILKGRHGFERVVGIDVAQIDPPAGVVLQRANLNAAWPFADGEVDYLIALMLIEHLFDPFHAFAQVRRVLKPGGVAYINLPLVTGLPNRLRLLGGRLPQTSVAYRRWFERRSWDGAHLHYFSMAAIRDLAADSGLKLGKVQGVGRFWRLKSALPGLLAGEVTFTLHHA